MSAGAARSRVIFALALTFGVVLLAVPVLLADGEKLLAMMADIDPPMLVLPVLLTLLSYVAMSRSYQGIAGAAGTPLGLGEWIRITLVSNTANYLVTSAGLSGFAVRLFLLSKRGVPSGRAVLISLVQTFLTNFALLLFVMIGLSSLALHHYLHGGALLGLGVAMAVFTAGLATAAVIASNARLRRRTIFGLVESTHRVVRRVAPRWAPDRMSLWRFQHNLDEGLGFLLARKTQVLQPAAWITLDWILTLAVLWAAFQSVNHPVAPGLIVIGFAVGVCLSLISLVPGGLGVMESSMTAVFVSLSVPLEPTVLAVLIFRVAYYVLPLLVSLFLFRGLVAQVVHSADSATFAHSARAHDDRGAP